MTGRRADHVAIASRVADRARVLDVGCGDGELLAVLQEMRGADARGLEISAAGAQACLEKGFSVIQGDADVDLEVFPDNGFDAAVLSKSLQDMRRPAHVLGELARIAPEILISFRNYGHWRRRLTLFATGRMPAPRTGAWHDAEALHPSTAKDLVGLAAELGLSVRAMAPVGETGVGAFREAGLRRLNWGAADAILHLARD
ncbi:MAG: methionine biosynthesis protein MetW [Pseudomonadota bacterium]